MDHIAILRKAKISKGDNLLSDILASKKTIESRWYVHKIAPWDRVFSGETVYFKESGGKVSAKANVSKVLQVNDLNSQRIWEIISEYGQRIAPGASQASLHTWAAKLKNKNYCILVFLNDVEKIQPFDIDKTGYGNACAWLCTPNIAALKI